MIRITIYLLVALVIFILARGFLTGQMSGKTTLSEVGKAMMEEYKNDIAKGFPSKNVSVSKGD